MKFEVSSNIEFSQEDASGLLKMSAVNSELSPLIRMTVPSAWSEKAIFEWPTGEVLFSSWILLFGIFPIDRHKFYFQSIDRFHGFEEQSSSLTNRMWQHRRDIDKNGASCRVTDTVEFECRLPLMAFVLAPVYRFIFQHRRKSSVTRHKYSTR